MNYLLNKEDFILFYINLSFPKETVESIIPKYYFLP